METAQDVGEVDQFVNGLSRGARRRDDLDVADGFLSTAERSGRNSPPDVRSRSKMREHRLGDRHRASERNAWDGCAQVRQRGGDGRLERLVESRHTPKGLG